MTKNDTKKQTRSTARELRTYKVTKPESRVSLEKRKALEE
jgi:hypothetical protein